MDKLPPPPAYSEEDPALSPRPAAQPPLYPAGSSTSSSSNVRVTQVSRSTPQPASEASGSAVPEDNPYMSGAPYFVMREPTGPCPSDVIVHRMELKQDSGPANLAFPSPAKKFKERGINNHDWSTFLNHLFPLHSIERTSQIHQRQQYGGDEKRAVKLSKSAPAPVKAPLPDEPIDLDKEVHRRKQMHRVVEEWNKGLFLPRGLRITMRLPIIATHLDVDGKSAGGVTALYKAVSKGDANLVETFVLWGANPDSKPFGGTPAISYAAEKGMTDIVKLLLSAGANVDASAPGSGTSLWILGSRSNIGFLNFLFPPTEAADEDVKIIKLLLSYGANVNSAPMGSETALCKAAGNGYMRLLRLLLEHGADTDAKPMGGTTAFYAASSRGDMAITKLLLEKGANPDKCPSGSNSALWHAVDRGDAGMVQLLLGAGANINAKPWGGETALCRAIGKGNNTILKMFLEFPGRGAKKAEVAGEMRRIADEKGLGELFQGREDDWFGQ